MNSILSEYYTKNLGIGGDVLTLAETAERELAARFAAAEAIGEYNQLKVLDAMRKNRLSEAHFAATTGYGYNDIGRECTERIFADVFCAQSGLVRPQIVSGTHALSLAMAANLKHGDELLSATGRPYDTLCGVIGIRAARGSLAENGVAYRQADLKADGSPDFEAIKAAIGPKTRMAAIQRSKGYAWRKSLSVKDIADIIECVKRVDKHIICMVDNCYGEFVEAREPSEYGADLVVGSLIKNPGGGIAPSGGYIVGSDECVENAACRLTAPGLGKELGASLGHTQPILQGLFLAPNAVCGAVKGAIFAAKLAESLGFAANPASSETRSDIVQAIRMNSEAQLLAFCEAIQKMSPVDSHVKPVPWDMPGYGCPVVMAAGTFVSGASIELSADAPIREPYTAFFQGGLSWFHAKAGVIAALNAAARVS